MSPNTAALTRSQDKIGWRISWKDNFLNIFTIFSPYIWLLDQPTSIEKIGWRKLSPRFYKPPTPNETYQFLPPRQKERVPEKTRHERDDGQDQPAPGHQTWGCTQGEPIPPRIQSQEVRTIKHTQQDLLGYGNGSRIQRRTKECYHSYKTQENPQKSPDEHD